MSPICFTDSGITISFKLGLSLQASVAITSTVSAMSKELILFGTKSSSVLFLLYNTPSTDVYDELLESQLTPLRLGHSANTDVPIDVTFSGMVMLFKFVQPLKTLSPIFSSESGKTISSKLVHL